MRKFIIILSVTFYASSLLIVIATLNQTARMEIYAELVATSEIYHPRPQMREDIQPGSDEEVPATLLGMKLAQPGSGARMNDAGGSSAASNASPKGRVRNRRVEMWFVPVDSPPQ